MDRTLIYIRLEPYAMKVARTVLSGGKLVKAYLSQLAFSTISQLGYMVAAVGQHYIFFLRPTINSLYAGNF